MNRLVRLCFVSLVVASSAIATTAPEQADAEGSAVSDKSDFYSYLEKIDEQSIHKALHLFEKFHHGVFPSDDDAVQALGTEDSSLAAHLNLKRDNSSTAAEPSATAVAEPTSTAAGTTATPTPTQKSTAESTTEHTTAQPNTQSTTDKPTTDKPTTTSETHSEPPSTHTTASTEPPSTHSDPKTTSTDSTPSATNSDSSSSSSSTTTKKDPTTMQTTTAPETTKKPETTKNTTPYTSTFKSTTTLPNGEQSTITSITVVHPTETNHEVATKTGAAPGLQTDNAASTTGLTRELFVMIGGAAMVAMAL
ncbi:putative GPI anchored cell wall protein (Dan4) [Aspergillus alliaceus]|uniref:putative GPI anchored cell wall protein (Dan4) n=1 Tax=Petromyces alliaceus TaxID=209559 RepID=UPI0012A46AD9|nr:uncharacterized protein BDW43DRAFT_178695 [Aspergillus alliaceus]KAB8237469.1 hypothetical protein BDW43DRAFT_178695 [Aspergillus alliaceus]